MTEVINKSTSPHMFNNLINAIKILAGKEYKEKVPFVYNDDKKEVACLILSDTVTFLYN